MVSGDGIFIDGSNTSDDGRYLLIVATQMMMGVFVDGGNNRNDDGDVCVFSSRRKMLSKIKLRRAILIYYVHSNTKKCMSRIYLLYTTAYTHIHNHATLRRFYLIKPIAKYLSVVLWKIRVVCNIARVGEPAC